jgi:type I restriction enzyme R subunit
MPVIGDLLCLLAGWMRISWGPVRDKLSENQAVMTQIANNTREQAMLGDFPKAIDDAVMDSNDAQQEMMVQYLSNPELAKGFARVVFDMLKGA